jgi:hypothetical protein
MVMRLKSLTSPFSAFSVLFVFKERQVPKGKRGRGTTTIFKLPVTQSSTLTPFTLLLLCSSNNNRVFCLCILSRASVMSREKEKAANGRLSKLRNNKEQGKQAAEEQTDNQSIKQASQQRERAKQ